MALRICLGRVGGNSRFPKKGVSFPGNFSFPKTSSLRQGSLGKGEGNDIDR